MKRRSFLQLGTAAVATSGLMNLPAVRASTTGNYKALVHVFLLGGNDGFNMIVPRSNSDYSEYAASRQNLAVAQNDLLAMNTISNHGAQYGMHPQLSELHNLYQSGKVAVMGNVGNLVEPVTKSAIDNATANLPRQLFSHNDQQDQWRYGDPSSISTGWGGRLADYFYQNNSERLLTSMAIDGKSNWLSAHNHLDLAISRNGFDRYNSIRPDKNWAANRRETFRRLLEQPATGFHKELSETQSRTMELVENVGISVSELADFTTAMPDYRLAERLQMVARMIALRETLGMERQVFYVTMGGFDTHDNQNTVQPALLQELSESMAYFYNVTQELGVADCVTTFTGSDFGRTLTSNGDGTDHAWASHHLVMGDSVRGGDIQGVMPSLETGGVDDVRSDGRIIPTSSIEQYADSLLGWFGLDESEKNTVFPNRQSFMNGNIQLML